MSAPQRSDPRLLLPEWLRDEDAPVPAVSSTEPSSDSPAIRVAARETVVAVEAHAAPSPAIPFSERLSLDTRLDPASLVSSADLPQWLGGLERVAPVTNQQNARAPAADGPALSEPRVETPDAYDEVDAPSSGVIDVEVNGWIVVAAAIGLLILLAAALKLYLS